MNKKILIVDNDPGSAQVLKRYLSAHGHEIETASTGSKGVSAFKDVTPDLVMCDLRLGDMDGLEMIGKIQEADPAVPFMVMSDNSDVRVAVTIMKSGALDFFSKPLVLEEILEGVERYFTTNKMDGASGGKDKDSEREFIFSNSEHSKELMKQIDLVAQTNYSVIIYGESGVGKEAIAQTIHKKSNRANGPFVAMDCGAISRELAGSELFGHEKGSFTGALSTKIGHFELANGGTLFLDEIANLPYDVQSSLLRVIQERKVRHIGGNKEIPFDVRIIIASNENLEESCKKGKFREDLYHRFNEFHISIHPLRERKEDIMFYADYFLKKTNTELQKRLTGFDEEVKDLFFRNAWFGNLRELKNIIRRAVLLSDGNLIQAQALPYNFAANPLGGNFAGEFTEFGAGALMMDKPNAGFMKNDEIRDLKKVALEAECELIQKVLRQTNYNKSKAAKMLKVNRKTLYNKIRSYNLDKAMEKATMEKVNN